MLVNKRKDRKNAEDMFNAHFSVIPFVKASLS